MRLNLSVDEALATTRSVRKRLDFSRPVERAVIEECLELARQAPTGSNRQHWHFVVVTDAAKRQALGDLYRLGWARAMNPDPNEPAGGVGPDHPLRTERIKPVYDSAHYLLERMQDAPALLIPCIHGRIEGRSLAAQAGVWGSILPAFWSFMIAARERGLGTCWTTVHLHYEREAADLLGIPYAEVMQTGLTPIAYTIGTDFKPAPRAPLETALHWDEW